MPLKLNEEGDLEYNDPVKGDFVATWRNLPLTRGFVSRMMDVAYNVGMQRNSDAYNKIVKIVKENT